MILTPLEVWFKDERYYEVSQSNSVALLSLLYELQTNPRDYLFIANRGVDYELTIQNQSLPILELNRIQSVFSDLFQSLKIRFNQNINNKPLLNNIKIFIVFKHIDDKNEIQQFKDEMVYIRQYVNQLGRDITTNGNQFII
jgi:hypothetical protein